MTREEKVAEALRLHAEGLNDREIGERLGVGASAVWKWRHPERARRAARASNAKRQAAKNAWSRENERAPCKGGCGKLTWHRTNSGYCRACHPDREARRERARLIEQWWAEGVRHREIARRLGWTPNQMSVEMARLRREGYDLPRARPYYGNGRDPSLSDRVAA